MISRPPPTHIGDVEPTMSGPFQYRLPGVESFLVRGKMRRTFLDKQGDSQYYIEKVTSHLASTVYMDKAVARAGWEKKKERGQKRDSETKTIKTKGHTCEPRRDGRNHKRP